MQSRHSSSENETRLRTAHLGDLWAPSSGPLSAGHCSEVDLLPGVAVASGGSGGGGGGLPGSFPAPGSCLHCLALGPVPQPVHRATADSCLLTPSLSCVDSPSASLGQGIPPPHGPQPHLQRLLALLGHRFPCGRNQQADPFEAPIFQLATKWTMTSPSLEQNFP